MPVGTGRDFKSATRANGQPYDMNAMTAAHRTLPLNTIARVTDVKTGDSVLLRITDRGPFVGDRVIDLSRAAARRLSVFQKGVALVRIEVLETPAPIKEGGRWCVQIGAFADARDASKLKEKLARRYRTRQSTAIQQSHGRRLAPHARGGRRQKTRTGSDA